MASNLVQYPGAGCIVEFMQGNEPQIAWVMEEQKGKLRLFLPNRRETTLSSARLLPWSGPAYAAAQSKDAMVELLEKHGERRKRLSAEVAPMELWEMAQGELKKARAEWFAELGYTSPDADTVAACGRALLACKTHFRFQPPEFEIYDVETVEARRQAEEAARMREAMVLGGADWFRRLWEARIGRRAAPNPAEAPEEPVRGRLEYMLRSRMADPDTVEDEALWKQVTKGLPDDPHLPLLLAMTWGLVPEHHNYWLDRADYEVGTAWEEAHRAETEALIAAVTDDAQLPPIDDTPFISIDSATTRDIDDAFHIERAADGGWDVDVALACPAWFWDFESPLGKDVFNRATSLYLPEGNSHMMPEALGEGAFSLFEGKKRPSLIVSAHIAPDGSLSEGRFRTSAVTLAKNLTYPDCEAVIEGRVEDGNPASAWTEQLSMAAEMSRIRLDYRVKQGAVIIERPDLDFVLEGEGADVKVSIRESEAVPAAMLLVAELMIVANAVLAEWAVKNDVALLFRTQDVAVPREYAGVWRSAPDIARVVRILVAASLDVEARPHAGMGLAAYSPVTSPLRRFPDLVNEAQLLHFLRHGEARWSREELSAMLLPLGMRLEAAGQVQRFRPRYWKYLYIQQRSARHHNACCWRAEVAEENDMWVNVNLPEVQIALRAKRQLFGEKVFPGQEFMVRLGKVNPLRNEAVILDVQEF
ncbi:MAG: RNB domain-containing ribonuclease [Mailhella sp.]|nr:RNB domain-containing ribonuclease [Mailhella sp.]